MLSASPQSVLLIRPDGLGDLILFQPVLAALRAGWPQATLTVLVRQRHCELGTLLFPEITWLGTAVDPFRQGPAAVAAELNALRAAISTLRADLVVACTEGRTWLDAAVAAMVPTARTVAFGSTGEDPFFGPQLRALYPEVPEQAFAEQAESLPNEQAWRRNFGLASYLLGREIAPVAPQLTADPAWAEQAEAMLNPWGFARGRFVVCAAAGFANVPLKTWPAERFAAVLKTLQGERELPAVLVGSREESAYLQAISAETGARVWISETNDWAALAALLDASRVVLGNDSGLLHLAAALGRPVVAVYGGGTWPRFIPAGPGAAVVNPLPCFGCGWDCVFGDAPCVQVIAAEEVMRALSHVLDVDLRGECAIMETHHVSSETAALMGIAAQSYLERGEVLNRREQEFQETVRLAAAKDGEIDSLKDAANTKDAEIQALKATTIKMDEEIAALKESAELRGRAADESAAEAEAVRAEAKHRAEEIEKLHRAAAELQQACDERLALIVRLDADLKRLQGR
jgi:ADP-heptose:LPS heptosyltransferase